MRSRERSLSSSDARTSPRPAICVVSKGADPICSWDRGPIEPCPPRGHNERCLDRNGTRRQFLGCAGRQSPERPAADAGRRAGHPAVGRSRVAGAFGGRVSRSPAALWPQGPLVLLEERQERVVSGRLRLLLAVDRGRYGDQSLSAVERSQADGGGAASLDHAGADVLHRRLGPRAVGSRSRSRGVGRVEDQGRAGAAYLLLPGPACRPSRRGGSRRPGWTGSITI